MSFTHPLDAPTLQSPPPHSPIPSLDDLAFSDLQHARDRALAIALAARLDTPPPPLWCPICLESHRPSSCTRTRCGHSFCTESLRTHVRVSAESGRMRVACPQCNHPLHLDDMNKLAEGDEETMERLGLGTVSCNICEDKHHPSACTHIGCGHQFCTACLRMHVRLSAAKGCTPIDCPQCSKPLQWDELMKLAKGDEETLQRLGASTVGCAICLERYAPDACTRTHCGHVFCTVCMRTHVRVSVENGRMRVTCPLCSVPMQLNETLALAAGDEETMTKLRRDRWADEDWGEFGVYAEERGWKRCPGCGFVIERTMGCSTVVCRCGCMFCFRCGGEAPGDGGREQGFRCVCRVRMGTAFVEARCRGRRERLGWRAGLGTHRHYRMGENHGTPFEHLVNQVLIRPTNSRPPLSQRGLRLREELNSPFHQIPLDLPTEMPSGLPNNYGPAMPPRENLLNRGGSSSLGG